MSAVSKKVVVFDYGFGNVRSAERALARTVAEVEITRDFDRAMNADGLLVPGVFCLLSVAERYFVTPVILGQHLSLNPVVIFVSVLFWGALWGVPGALLAVPILIALKTLCDRVEHLKVFGKFLGA